jgi:hypothetical protein
MKLCITLKEKYSYRRVCFLIDKDLDTLLTVILDEISLLKDIHHRVWQVLTIDRPDILRPVVEQEADTLARRFLSMFSICVKRKPSLEISTPLEMAEDWIHLTKAGLPRFQRLAQLFATCIKLRDTIALSEYCYELYWPSAFEGRFTDADQDEWGRQIRYCVFPAILEHEPDEDQRGTYAVTSLFGAQRIITTNAEAREKSLMMKRMICPASVTFWP